jgi:large subunit ribosomal protein L4
MAEITVRDWNNKEVGKLELDDGLVGYELREHLIYEAVCAYQAAARAGTHKAKNRTEVSGGTRKLWKQKHTGRARMGDNRSPLWRHGGTIHGPQPRDYTWKFPKKMRRNAIKSALAQKLREGKVVCLDSLQRESAKSKELEAAVTKDLGLGGKVLLVPEEENRNLDLAARNNPRLHVVRALGVSIVDVVGHETLVFSKPALERLGEVLGR